ELHRGSVRRAFADAVAAADRDVRDLDVPAIIDGDQVRTSDRIESIDPGDPRRTVAMSASCGVDEAELAIDYARAALPDWAATSTAERAAVLVRAAAWMRERRTRLAALQVFEAGKPWAEADADVC